MNEKAKNNPLTIQKTTIEKHKEGESGTDTLKEQ